MSKKDFKLPDGWENDKDFAEFFKDYVENDDYLKEENEPLKAYITYRALYNVYIHTLNAQSKITSITDKFSQYSNAIKEVNRSLDLLNKVVDEQEKIHESVQFYVKIMVIGLIVLLIIMGYLIYKLFVLGAFMLF